MDRTNGRAARSDALVLFGVTGDLAHKWMPRSERRGRCWASADSYFRSISASPIDGTSESAHCQDESCRYGPSDVE